MENLEKMLRLIGEKAGVGEDWYTIGEPGDPKNTYGIYGKTDEITETVETYLQKLFEVKEDDIR